MYVRVWFISSIDAINERMAAVHDSNGVHYVFIRDSSSASTKEADFFSLVRIRLNIIIDWLFFLSLVEM